MAEKESKVLLSYEVDKASIKAAENSIKTVRQSVTNIGGDFKKAADVARSSGADIGRSIDDGVTAAVRTASQEVDTLGRKIDSVGDKSIKLDVSGAQGDLSSGLSAFAGLAGGLGADSGALQLGADITGAIEQVSRFKEAVATTGAALQNTTGTVGTLASTGASLGGVFGTLGASIGSIVAVAAPVAAAVAAIGIAFKLFTDLLAQQQAALEDAKAQLAGDTQGRIDNAIAIRNASADSVKAQLEEQQIKLQIIQADLATRKAQLKDIQDQYAALGAAFDPARRAALGQAGQLLEDSISELTAQEQELNRSIQNTTDVILPGVEAREREQEAIRGSETALRDREAAEKTLAGLYEQRNRALEQAAQQEAQINQDRNRTALRDEEDFNRQREDKLKDNLQKLADIDAAGLDKLASIREQGNNKIAAVDTRISALNQQINDVASKYLKSRARLESDAAKSRADAIKKSQQDETRALQDFNRRKAEIQKSYDDALLSATENNDVVAAIEAQRQKTADTASASGDYGTAKADRAQALADELAKIEEIKQARLADLQAQADEQRAALQAQITEEHANRAQIIAEIQAQLDAEKKRIEETKKATLAAQQEALAKEDEARALRLRRLAEDEQIADRRRADSLARQLTDIDNKARKEAQAAGIVETAWLAAASRIAAAASSLGGSSRSSSLAASGYSSPVSRGGARLVAFASGGVVKQPTLALMGERPGYNEAIMPFRKSEGIEAALSRLNTQQSAPTFNFGNIELGGGVSPADFESTMNQFAMTVIQAVGSARSATA